MFHLLDTFAEFERNSLDGQAAARAHDRLGN